ncbi:murein hydrolase activator EnvC family protein [Salinibius halmophilus]|uniref:murein hydrolase activator EnvC family protein n=1 Tax=Salinibius halmophilus TaxID=1853216 RepID=UPI000E664546|nr:peptidoglycan DD-metalloendopeptidase family protein [Salinibius halmophilus]
MNLRTVTIFLMLALLSALSSAQEASEFKLKQLTEAVSRIEARLAEQNRELSAQERKLIESDRAIAQNKAQQNTLEREIARLNSEQTRLNRQQETLQQALAEQEDAVAEILVSVYQSSRQPMLKMLLSQDGPATLARTLAYFEYINDAQRQVLENYQADLAALNETKQQINANRTRLRNDQQALDRAQAKLVQQQQSRRQVINDLQQNVAGTESQLSQTRADQARMAALVEEMRQALAALEAEPAPPVPNGQLGWPVQGRVVQAYGAPLGDSRVRSQGVVIAANAGLPVTAVHDGRVVFANWLKGFGMLVIVDHGGGLLTLYGRNDALLVEDGQSVGAGDALALVGSSGGFNQTGLYFEVRQNGSPVNPVSWLARR